ncbi:MAG: hypothetical protein J7L08_01780 [Candidatus Aenigmarchaeota archaeon]|nr:hypothetical protein [Candidatus Aenigmarchaeota archaeon]
MPQKQEIIKPRDKILIFVDNREFNSKVVKELARLDCIIKPKQLEVGDYILSERVCVERKTSADLISSIFDQRIFIQLKNMKNNFQKPLLLIEGKNLYTERNVHPNAIRGALASIAIDYSIPIIWTDNEKDTAGIVYWIARREQIEEERSLAIRSEKKPSTLKEQQEFFISGLPNVNTKISKRLLGYFGSPEKVISASEEKLKKVDGIGDKLAKNIRKLLTEKYKN